jgi:hypothetical protein
MKNVIKLIITSKNNLKQKYGTDFAKIQKLFTKLKAADKICISHPRSLHGDKVSAKSAGIPVMTHAEKVQDGRGQPVQKHHPLTWFCLGLGYNSFPEISNPVKDRDNDDDVTVPSDLPYACNEDYSTVFSSFTAYSRGGEDSGYTRYC